MSRQNSLGSQTLGEVKARRPHQAHTQVRQHAQQIFKSSGQSKKCRCCEYAKHVEICHSPPISHYSNTATLDEINAIENLIPLCPNCHWEFDHELLLLIPAHGGVKDQWVHFDSVELYRMSIDGLDAGYRHLVDQGLVPAMPGDTLEIGANPKRGKKYLKVTQCSSL